MCSLPSLLKLLWLGIMMKHSKNNEEGIVASAQCNQVSWRRSIHYCRNCTTVSFPHTTESGLTSKVPQFYSDITFSHFPHVKSHLNIHPVILILLSMNLLTLKAVSYSTKMGTYRWYHIFTISTSLRMTKVSKFSKTSRHMDIKRLTVYVNAGTRKGLSFLLTAITFTSEVFPAFCSPIKESSISCLKKRLQNEQVSMSSYEKSYILLYKCKCNMKLQQFYNTRCLDQLRIEMTVSFLCLSLKWISKSK